MNDLWDGLLQGIVNLSYGNLIMFVIGGILIYLAIKKDYEPALLLPIGFGAILSNIPLSSAGSWNNNRVISCFNIYSCRCND